MTDSAVGAMYPMYLRDTQSTIQASRNALLATKVGQVLEALGTRPLGDADRAVLRRGAELLAEIVRGSLLISGQGTELGGLGPSESSLGALSRALSAARQLRMLTGNPDVTALFVGFRDKLLRTADDGTLTDEERRHLIDFFDVLASLFERDVEHATFPSRRTPATATS